MNPINTLHAFCDRKATQLRDLCDEGGLFEIRFLRRLITREQVEVTTAAGEAVVIDSQLSALSSQLKADLAPDDDTPGVLDASELARLQHALKRLGHDQHAHTSHLQQLV